MITVVGLGPGDLDRVSRPVMSLLLDLDRTVIARTREHPASLQLAAERSVVFCDDLYETEGEFDAVYRAIADRVVEAANEGPVIYVVPGSPTIGEFTVRKLVDSEHDVEVIPGESFVDIVLNEVRYDPLDRGLQILNGHELPDPLVLDKPTIVGHLDRPEVLADVCAQIDRVVPDEAVVTVLSGVGSTDAHIVTTRPDQVDADLAGYRTSLFLDTEPGGLIGAVRIMRQLREECPWDREQTHRSLVKNLVEETYELIEAIGNLNSEESDSADVDWVAYAEVEDELGDVLLQVLFHSVIARQVGAFDLDDVAEVMRQKLVRRHPHVFGDVVVSSAADVKTNWDRIKTEERGGVEAVSSLDGVPIGMPALHRASKIQNRAAKVGFDWDDASQVMPKLHEELSELDSALAGDGDVEGEMGDLLFTVVNLARHLGVDPEVALRAATSKFDLRFRRMEADGPLSGLDLDQLNARWESAKS